MSTAQTVAARALDRALRGPAALHDLHAAADHEFDAGEWSDGANARQWESMVDAIAERVAARFGMTRAELEHAYRYWCEDTAERCRWGADPDPMGTWHGRNE